MTHHILNEQHQKETCPYCRKNLESSRWNSEFSNHQHYKTTKCSCGKLISIRMDFHGSGHDNWSNNHTIVENSKEEPKIRKLEDKIKEVKIVSSTGGVE